MTVSVDEAVATAAAAAVAEGRADSVSAWVNDALVVKVAGDRRRDALADAVSAYEADEGELTAGELAGQARADRDEAASRRSHAKRRRGAA